MEHTFKSKKEKQQKFPWEGQKEEDVFDFFALKWVFKRVCIAQLSPYYGFTSPTNMNLFYYT